MIAHQWTVVDTFYLTDLGIESTLTSVHMVNEGVEGMGNPPHKAFTRETALLDGETNSGWKALPREVFWPLLIDATPDTWDTVQSAFWATMRPNLYGIWTVYNGETSRYLNCRYLSDGGAAYAYDPSRLGAEFHGVSLIADRDPWWHSEDVSATFQTAETPVDFFNGGTAPDFYIMSGNTVDSASIDNPGDVPAWPTYRIDGPATAFSIETSADMSSGEVSGEITVLEGEWLVIDTNPTAQTAFLYTAENVYTDVTYQLSEYQPQRIEIGTDTLFSVYLLGEGSLTVTITPSYFRAF